MLKSIGIDEFPLGTVEWDLNFHIVAATMQWEKRWEKWILKGRPFFLDDRWVYYMEAVYVWRMYRILHKEEMPFIHPFMQVFAKAGVNDCEFVNIEEDRTA